MLLAGEQSKVSPKLDGQALRRGHSDPPTTHRPEDQVGDSKKIELPELEAGERGVDAVDLLLRILEERFGKS